MKIHSDYFWRTKNHLNQIMTIKYFQIICIQYASPRIFFMLLSQNYFNALKRLQVSAFSLSQSDKIQEKHQNFFWLESKFQIIYEFLMSDS